MGKKRISREEDFGEIGEVTCRKGLITLFERKTLKERDVFRLRKSRKKNRRPSKRQKRSNFVAY